ncbi:MAG: hypothetical protein M0036_14295 [Desulfobacteraceae bacterium]|nr:hypothetical protein [Desulfobacteraceae bacterium]
MSFEEKDDDSPTSAVPPLVVADYGGRRKIFERRLGDKTDQKKDRRSGQERRSGFDRRGIVEDDNLTNSEKRKK